MHLLWPAEQAQDLLPHDINCMAPATAIAVVSGVARQAGRVANRDLLARSLYSGCPKCVGWRFPPLQRVLYIWSSNRQESTFC